jgi:hypothetical protein
MTAYYGESPVTIAPLELPEWEEFMHYLYLPVRIPRWDDGNKRRRVWALPPRLGFLKEAIDWAFKDALFSTPHLDDPYVYVTARRGFATPGNPLNRPGWHCDDFGGTDVNYIWTDRFPTRWISAMSDLLQMPEDDADSMVYMQDVAVSAEMSNNDVLFMDDMPVNTLMRLSPYVIHDTPIIEEPGGMRSFFKISVSTHRYDLIGNSHNHMFDYDWPMVSREEMRNKPSGGNADYSGGTT